jgi:TetR/AcrR family tetracycline transcriptional repressor
VLSGIAEPGPGPWHERLVEMYSQARRVLLDVPGIAGVLQTNGDGECARRLDGLSRKLIEQSGLTKAGANASHPVLYTYLLGSVGLEESRPPSVPTPSERQAASRFRAGLAVIVSGIRASSQISREGK